jgi:hypothetical protein
LIRNEEGGGLCGGCPRALLEDPISAGTFGVVVQHNLIVVVYEVLSEKVLAGMHGKIKNGSGQKKAIVHATDQQQPIFLANPYNEWRTVTRFSLPKG